MTVFHENALLQQSNFLNQQERREREFQKMAEKLGGRWAKHALRKS